MVQEVAIRCEFEAGIHHAKTGKTLSVNPALNEYLFPIKEG